MTPLYKKFGCNAYPGRDIIAGDLHGTLDKFMEALAAAKFNAAVGDRLFLVGDLVDRGPQSFAMLDLLNMPGVHAVRGNHEQMAIDWVAGSYDDKQNYIANGGGWFLALTRREQVAFAKKFAALPIAIELDTESGLVGIVHAECPFPEFRKLELALASEHSDDVINFCIWSRCRTQYMMDEQVSDVRAVIVGHTPMTEVTSFGNHIYIDTMGWRGGEFTLLDAATLQPVRAQLGVA